MKNRTAKSVAAKSIRASFHNLPLATRREYLREWSRELKQDQQFAGGLKCVVAFDSGTLGGANAIYMDRKKGLFLANESKWGDFTPVNLKGALKWYAKVAPLAKWSEGTPALLCAMAAERLKD